MIIPRMSLAMGIHASPCQVLRDMNIFFECQAPGSDTCGLNALNNLCQQHMFSVEDLQQAEAQHAQLTQPVPDYRKSRCFEFAEASQNFGDGAYLLGFLVYDRQPGHMHYYALCRQPRMPGGFV